MSWQGCVFILQFRCNNVLSTSEVMVTMDVNQNLASCSQMMVRLGCRSSEYSFCSTLKESVEVVQVSDQDSSLAFLDSFHLEETPSQTQSSHILSGLGTPWGSHRRRWSRDGDEREGDIQRLKMKEASGFLCSDFFSVTEFQHRQ